MAPANLSLLKMEKKFIFMHQIRKHHRKELHNSQNMINGRIAPEVET